MYEPNKSVSSFSRACARVATLSLLDSFTAIVCQRTWASRFRNVYVYNLGLLNFPSRFQAIESDMWAAMHGIHLYHTLPVSSFWINSGLGSESRPPITGRGYHQDVRPVQSRFRCHSRPRRRYEAVQYTLYQDRSYTNPQKMDGA